MEACPTPQAADPCAIVIFGASGDLTKRKLLPSLYNHGSYYLLPAHFSIIGVARRPLSDDVFRDQLGKDLAKLGTQLRSIHFSTPEEALTDTVRGQYGEGIVGGKKVSGYRQEPNVNPNSTVETYAAIKLRIDNWRWAGVPFYLRSGKRMPRRTTTIVIRFKTPPLSLFAGHEADPISPNYLIFKIQPEEGIALQVRAKIPGPTISTRSVKLDFGYDQFGDRQPTTGYEKLLYDCMVGDASLFHRSDVVEAAWEAAAPILEAWNNNPPTDFPNYAAGTWGPEAALRLIQRDQHHWFSSDRL
jgi:glucose-6-phosphate 1-dehydrogenase